MVNIQEQVKIGFNHISSELRSLSSSVSPRQRISQPKQKSIEHRPASIDESDDDLEADNEQEDIEEINREYEDSYSEGEEYEDSKLQEEAQKDLVKRKRKEIRVNFVNMLCLHNR